MVRDIPRHPVIYSINLSQTMFTDMVIRYSPTLSSKPRLLILKDCSGTLGVNMDYSGKVLELNSRLWLVC